MFHVNCIDCGGALPDNRDELIRACQELIPRGTDTRYLYQLPVSQLKLHLNSQRANAARRGETLHLNNNDRPLADLRNAVLARVRNPTQGLRASLNRMPRADLEHMVAGLSGRNPNGAFSVNVRADDEAIQAMSGGGLSTFRANSRLASVDGMPRVHIAPREPQPSPVIDRANFRTFSAKEAAEYAGPPSSHVANPHINARRGSR
jgi:hypothetical protein